MESRKKQSVLAWAAVAAFAAAPALADLNPNGSLKNPGAATGPYYTTSLPSWVSGANLIGHLVANMDGSATGGFTGTVESSVYQIDATHLGFTYVYHVDTAVDPTTLANTTLDGSSFSSAGWNAVNISDAGADGTGSSHAAPNSPFLSNGDPFSLSRSGGGGSVGDLAEQVRAVWRHASGWRYLVGYFLRDGRDQLLYQPDESV